MAYEFDEYGRPILGTFQSAIRGIGSLFSRDPEVQAQVDEAKRQRMMALPDDHPNKIHFLSQQRQMAPNGSGVSVEIEKPFAPRPIPPMPIQPTRPPMPTNQNIQPRPTPPPMPPQLPPPRRTPSKWDMIKESMFAGEDQRGLFGQAGVDPRTKIGRGSMGLTGFFGDLFDDPRRMAMLSGGLTALDPSSYYDKEGFGSPWTGLRAGLGAGGAGYKSVIDRRKAEAETALAKAKTTAEGEDVSKWKHAPLGDAALLYSNKEINRERKRLMQQDPTLSITEANQQAVENTSIRKEKGIPKKSMFEIKKAFTSGQGQLAQIEILEGYAQDAFNAGFAGMGKRAWDAIKGAASIDSDTTESTKLVDGINQLVAQNWKDIVGSGPLSKGDKEFIDIVVKSPKDKFTTAAQIRTSLARLKRILRETQGRRAETIGVDYDPSVGPAPSLKGGGDIDALIERY